MKILLPVVMACAMVAAPASAESVTPKFEHVITNIPGKSLVTAEVDFPPGDPSAPHRHAKSAFLYVYVLQGAIESQVEGEAAPHVYRAGDSFFEAPGAHHVLGRNASATEPAKILAVFVVDSNDKVLTVYDKEGHKQ
ncbi:cupin domain-containing protein [Bradyrhizobium sp. Ce-3]|uniref:cupin domain-containing protein n=1 Tax=Bradyrhizobium sp. Ce-3 TaxID=2913970 RepID=UPI001FBAD89E|nr:cupin domain-containing protein [Bradyrhizobium sp. Ce-3]GKQ49566.1 cupin [Bradyrhizobium sp. Ce-3]